MKNNINNKRERDAKSVVITLGRGVEGYYYMGDSLTERSKIKIPLDELTGKDNFGISSFPGSAEILREKSERKSVKLDSVQSQHEDTKMADSSSMVAPANMAATVPEEMPMLAKMVEKNLKQQIILPTCAQWFKFDEIHEIEMKTLPEFFCGKYPSKSPEIYKEYRNFIINLYRENPNSFLSATSKKKNLK